MENGNLKKAIITALIAPLELALGWLLARTGNLLVNVLITDVIFFGGFFVAIYLYRDILKQEWKKYRIHIWRNLLLALLSLVGTTLILSAVRSGMGIMKLNDISALSISSAGITVVASLTTLMAPFTEEIIFRHALFYAWFQKRYIRWILFVLSSIAFGLIHWNNFNGNIVQMVPYMFVGAWFAFIYVIGKNIWHSIMAHFFFDFPNFLAAILVLVVSLITK